jgi:transposase-like protein
VSEEQVARVRRRRSRAEAEQLVAEYEASGLTGVEFCRERGVALGTLARYRKRGRQAQGEAVGASRWLAVELSGPCQTASSGLAVVLRRGWRIEIGRGFDAHTLEQLLRVLEPV